MGRPWSPASSGDQPLGRRRSAFSGCSLKGGAWHEDRVYRAWDDGSRYRRQSAKGRLRAGRSRSDTSGRVTASRKRRDLGRHAARARRHLRYRLHLAADADRCRGGGTGRARPRRRPPQGRGLVRPLHQRGRCDAPAARASRGTGRRFPRRAGQRRPCGSEQRQASDLGRRGQGGVSIVANRCWTPWPTRHVTSVQSVPEQSPS